MNTRQARRARQRELATVADQALARGIPRRAPAPPLLALVDRVARHISAARDAVGAAEAARLVHKVFESSMDAQPPGIPIACKRGCNWCCHTAVTALVPEILLVALVAASMGGRSEAIAAAAAAVQGLSPEQRLGSKVACPMLSENGCSVYVARPTMCRVATSTDVKACIDEFEGRDLSGDIPVAMAPIEHGFNARTILVAAIRVVGLDDGVYDLALGLQSCVDVGGATTRWLAGQRAFDGVPQVPLDATVHTRADELVRAHKQVLG